MSILSELHNWQQGGAISNTDKFKIVVRIIGLFIVIYGGWLIHPGVALMVFGIVMSQPGKKD